MPDLNADPPVYYAGDLISLLFQFENGDEVKYLTADFRHELDDYIVVELESEGAPEKWPTRSGGGVWEVNLNGDISADHAPGLYKCREIRAHYRGGISLAATFNASRLRFQV